MAPDKKKKKQKQQNQTNQNPLVNTTKDKIRYKNELLCKTYNQN